jgi:hypothetical protein
MEEVDHCLHTAHFFIEGAGGTGKTFFYPTICSYYCFQRYPVLCVASTGIASLLLPGGHLIFGIPMKLNETS